MRRKQERYCSFELYVIQVQQVENAMYTYVLQILRQLPWQAQFSAVARTVRTLRCHSSRSSICCAVAAAAVDRWQPLTRRLQFYMHSVVHCLVHLSTAHPRNECSVKLSILSDTRAVVCATML
jgi:hypothetical protein